MAASDPVIGTELGPEFDQGVIQANTVRLKLGVGLALQPDGTINVVFPEEIYARVNPNGTVQSSKGCTVVRNSLGSYQVTLNNAKAASTYPIVLTVESDATRDDIMIDYTNVQDDNFEVRTSEQDNGGTAGVFRDMGFTVFIPAD